jgi:hypothetical protein
LIFVEHSFDVTHACPADDLDDIDQIFPSRSETSMEAALDDMHHVDSTQHLARYKEISMHPIKISTF